MVTKILHIMALAGMLCLSCISCSDETVSQQVVPDNSKGQVKIMYKIAGSSLSRATEPGWTGDWHENLITRVDLFVFTNEGQYYDHIEVSAAEGEYLSDTDEDRYTPLETDELTYENVSEGDYTYYMVANCPQLAGRENITLTQLQQEEMIETAIVLDKKQDFFVMDGEGVRTDTDGGQTITLSFNLSRAAVKIRLAVKDKDGKSILNQCKYSFQNYVTAGTSVMAESEAYGEGTGQSRICMERNADETFPTTMRYDGKAVFYSYPNDWFDESLLNEEGTFTDPEIYAKDDLIDEEKQTYILLKAPFTNEEGITVESYYKVPVNFTIADYNDKTSFSKEEIETLRDDYYRMKRNYIYDITVTIDHEGGTYLDPEELKNLILKVNPWNREDITVDYTDELSYTNGGWDNQTLLTPYPNENNTIVHINPKEPAVFHFTIQSPNTARWRAQLTGDVDAFRFVDGINSGSVQYNDEGNAVQQELKIEAVYPGSEERFEAQLHFYADIAGKTYELDLTNKSTSPIEPSEPDESTEIPYFTILQSK